jgi:hypothetical protein
MPKATSDKASKRVQGRKKPYQPRKNLYQHCEIPNATSDKAEKRDDGRKEPCQPRKEKPKKPRCVRPGELGPEVIPAKSLTAAERSMLRSDLDAPLAKFELFPYLPIELRLDIWDLARPDSRRIEVIFKADRRRIAHAFRADVPTPFGICRESRYRMKQIYKSAFDNPAAENTCYIDFNRDCLSISGSFSSPQLTGFLFRPSSKEDFARLQRFAVSESASSWLISSNTTKAANFFLSLTSLREYIYLQITSCREYTSTYTSLGKRRWTIEVSESYHTGFWDLASPLPTNRQCLLERMLNSFRNNIRDPSLENGFISQPGYEIISPILPRLDAAWPSTVFIHKCACELRKPYLSHLEYPRWTW